MTPGFLGRALGRLRTRASGAEGLHELTELPADRPVYAIGDVHGSLGLLRQLLGAIAADAAALGRPARVLVLGDLVDRGPDSAGVLELARSLTVRGALWPILGNHERMMLDFLADPRGRAEWLEMGGFETLRSYGLPLEAREARRLPLRRLRQKLAAHVPEDIVAWLSALPLGYRLHRGDTTVVFAHADYTPDAPLTRQPERPLLWGAPVAVPDGQLLVHGHYILPQAGCGANRIGVDTGAWQSGRLTAVRIWGNEEPRFICAGGSGCGP